MPPTNTSPPSITGYPQEAEQLTVNDGVWTGGTASHRRWQSSADGGALWTDIPSTTAATYTVPAADVGKRLRVVVTAIDASGASAEALSAPTDLVAAADADMLSRLVTAALLALALVVGVFVGGIADISRKPFQVDTANFALFAAFYAAAQAIERLLEPVSQLIPPWGPSARARADRTLIMLGLATLVGVLASMFFGLYFIEAIGAVDKGDEWLRGFDIFVTGLIIAGGTKPLHDLIKTIEKTKTGAGA